MKVEARTRIDLVTGKRKIDRLIVCYENEKAEAYCCLLSCCKSWKLWRVAEIRGLPFILLRRHKEVQTDIQQNKFRHIFSPLRSKHIQHNQSHKKKFSVFFSYMPCTSPTMFDSKVTDFFRNAFTTSRYILIFYAGLVYQKTAGKKVTFCGLFSHAEWFSFCNLHNMTCKIFFWLFSMRRF